MASMSSPKGREIAARIERLHAAPVDTREADADQRRRESMRAIHQAHVEAERAEKEARKRRRQIRREHKLAVQAERDARAKRKREREEEKCWRELRAS